VIVLAILMGVDRVVTDGPAYGTGIKDDRGPIESPKHARPAEQGAPIEGEPKHGLRPIAESLDEWIKGDDRQHAKPEQDREAVGAQAHREADQAAHEDEQE